MDNRKRLYVKDSHFLSQTYPSDFIIKIYGLRISFNLQFQKIIFFLENWFTQ